MSESGGGIGILEAGIRHADVRDSELPQIPLHQRPHAEGRPARMQAPRPQETQGSNDTADAEPTISGAELFGSAIKVLGKGKEERTLGGTRRVVKDTVLISRKKGDGDFVVDTVGVEMRGSRNLSMDDDAVQKGTVYMYVDGLGTVRIQSKVDNSGDQAKNSVSVAVRRPHRPTFHYAGKNERAELKRIFDTLSLSEPGKTGELTPTSRSAELAQAA